MPSVAHFRIGGGCRLKKRIIAFLLLIAALLPVVVAAAPATTLEVVWMAWPKDMVDKLIAGFEKQNPGIKVDVQLVPFTQIFQTLEVRLPAGGTPDVYRSVLHAG
jgi:ABC-type glycerol-3-phosphate transport system substrate-binding protein